MKGTYENDNIIHSLPYNNKVYFIYVFIKRNKDVNVAKMLRLKLNGINQKLRKAKQLVHDLRQKREELRILLIKEERKRRDNPYASRGSSNSKASASIDKGQKWHFNLNELDDLNESFFSVNTSISRSPINKDRIPSSIETSFVEGRSYRDNRFGPRKSHLSRTNKRNKENHESEATSYVPSTEIKDYKDSSHFHQEYLSTNPTLGNGETQQLSEFGNKAIKRDPKQIFLKKNTPDWGESRKSFPFEKKDFESVPGMPDEIFLEKTHSKDSFAKREDLLKLINDIKEFDGEEKEGFEAETFGTNLLKEIDSQ